MHWVGLGWVDTADGLGWIGSNKMDAWTTVLWTSVKTSRHVLETSIL